MSSDKSQTQVSGTVAAIGQMGAREGALSAAMKRAAVDRAPVAIRAMGGNDALDAALTDSEYRAKSDSELKALGAAVLEEMRNNPTVQAKSGTDWAQKNIAQAGLMKELQKLIEGTPVVEERQCQTNIQHLLAAKSLTEMSPIQVKFLQQNLERLGLYSGKIDGDFTNPAMVASLDGLAHSEKAIGDSMKGSRASLAFVMAMRQTEPPQSHEKAFMDMLRQDKPSQQRAAVPALTL